MAHSVVLVWGAPDDVTAVSTYNIYRTQAACPASGLDALAFTKINTTPITALTFMDSSVQVGKAYCYYGTQVQNASESIPSNTAGGIVTPHTITIQLVVS